MTAFISRPSAIEIAWNSWRDFATANRPGRMTRFIGAVFGSKACRNYEHYERGFRERFIEVACKAGRGDVTSFRALVDRQVKVFDVPQSSGLGELILDARLLSICLLQARVAQRDWLKARSDDAALAWRPVSEPDMAAEELAERLKSMSRSEWIALTPGQLEAMYEAQLRKLQKEPPSPEAVLRSHDFAPELADRAFKVRLRELFAEPGPATEPFEPESSHRVTPPSAHMHLNGAVIESQPAHPVTTTHPNPIRRLGGTLKAGRCAVEKTAPVAASNVATEMVFQGLDRLWRNRI